MKDKELVEKELKQSALTKIKTAKLLSSSISQVIKVIIDAYRNNLKVILIGNGGSAADAQHIAAELVGRFNKEGKTLEAVALTTNTSMITAIANDYNYDTIFSRQLEAAGKEGDILIAISTSGNSGNILKAAKVARFRKIKVIGLIGKGGGKLKRLCDFPLVVPSYNTQRVQEVHITIGHIICNIVERELSKDEKTKK